MTSPTGTLTHRFPIALFCLCCLVLSLATGCSTIPTSKPLPPVVEIADIELVKMGFPEQEFDFTLDVFNPNNFNLPVNTLEFIASSNKEAIAKGASQQSVLLKANANTQVIINVQARVNRALKKLLAQALSGEKQFDYNVTGFVKLDNWPARIPFNVDKVLEFDGS